jgi:hypothetical protein
LLDAGQITRERMRGELDHERAREHLPRPRGQLENLSLSSKAFCALPVALLQPYALAQVQRMDLLQRILLQQLGPRRGRSQPHLRLDRSDACGDRMANDLERRQLGDRHLAESVIDVNPALTGKFG